MAAISDCICLKIAGPQTVMSQKYKEAVFPVHEGF